MSETDFVDSTSAHAGWPRSRSRPPPGSCTYTTSPSASWAKSVIPTRARLAVDRDPLVLLRVPQCSGNSMPRGRPTAATCRMRRAYSWASCRAFWSLSPSAQTWVSASSGSGSTSAQPSGCSTFTPSTSTTSRWAGALDHLAHHRALALPRRRHGLVGDVHAGQALHDRRQRAPGRGEQVEQLDERRGGVERGQEVGPDEPAVGRRREVDVARRTPPP